MSNREYFLAIVLHNVHFLIKSVPSKESKGVLPNSTGKTRARPRHEHGGADVVLAEPQQSVALVILIDRMVNFGKNISVAYSLQ